MLLKKTLLQVSAQIKYPELRKSQNTRCSVNFSISTGSMEQNKAVSSNHYKQHNFTQRTCRSHIQRYVQVLQLQHNFRGSTLYIGDNVPNHSPYRTRRRGISFQAPFLLPHIIFFTGWLFDSLPFLILGWLLSCPQKHPRPLRHSQHLLFYFVLPAIRKL